MNKWTGIGLLTMDPSPYSFPGGYGNCTVRMVTFDKAKNKETNELEDTFEYHNLIFKNRQAEFVSKHCKKNSKLYVEGPIKYRAYNGATISEIHVSYFEFLDKKDAS